MQQEFVTTLSELSAVMAGTNVSLGYEKYSHYNKRYSYTK